MLSKAGPDCCRTKRFDHQVNSCQIWTIRSDRHTEDLLDLGVYNL